MVLQQLRKAKRFERKKKNGTTNQTPCAADTIRSLPGNGFYIIGFVVECRQSTSRNKNKKKNIEKTPTEGKITRSTTSEEGIDR